MELKNEDREELTTYTVVKDISFLQDKPWSSPCFLTGTFLNKFNFF